jgi:hypothetical protein
MEQTNYYAVKRAPLAEIKEKLTVAGLTALIADGALHRAENLWIVIEAPRSLGCTVQGDYSTFSVLFDPWETLKKQFAEIIELFIEEGQIDWTLKCSLNREEKFFKFYSNANLPSFSERDHTFLSTLFEISIDRLIPCLKPGMAIQFCELVSLPFFEMEMQDNLADVLQKGSVIFSSDLKD